MSFPMKTGTSDAVSVHQKALILSLLSVYIEETCKTALLYALHHGHSAVTPEDMLKSLKYQMISENGCGQELKLNLKEAMETETITELEQKHHGQNAVKNHLPNALSAISQNSTAGGQTKAVISSIIGYNDVDENRDEDSNEDSDDDSNEDGSGGGIGGDGGDGLDSGNSVDGSADDDEGEDEDESEETSCVCEMCSEMDRLYGIEVEPRDDLEKMIMGHFQTVYDKYQK
jgi:hypothetical protein